MTIGKGKIGLLVAAAAAYGIYRYSKMTPQQKKAMKAKGKEFFDKNIGGLGDFLGKKTPVTANGR